MDMSANQITCANCGVLLKTKEPSPGGKLIRCPACRMVFRAAGSKSSSAAVVAKSEILINCTHCGATLQTDLPLRPGQVAQCAECSTIFRVPLYVFLTQQRGRRFAEPPRPAVSDVIPLQACVYTVKSEAATKAELVKPWDRLPDELLMEQDFERRKPGIGRKILVAVVIVAALGCIAATILLVWASTFHR
jgi:hypothetical protein